MYRRFGKLKEIEDLPKKKKEELILPVKEGQTLVISGKDSEKIATFLQSYRHRIYHVDEIIKVEL